MAKGATKAEKATIDEVSSQEDFKDFFKMLQVTGQVEREFDDLPTDDQRDIVNKFYLWKEKGSPKAEMPQLKVDKEDEILSLYRTKYRGEQFIWYVTKDGREVGREWDIKYAQEEDFDDNGKPLGTFHDSKHIVERKPKYTTPYNKQVGEELVALAFKYNDSPVFVFEIGGKRFGIDDPLTEFNCDSREMNEVTKRIIATQRRR